MFKTIHSLDEDFLTALWAVYINGTEKQNLTGRKYIRLFSGINKAFDECSTNDSNGKRTPKNSTCKLTFDMDSYKHIEVCFDNFEMRPVHAHIVSATLDRFLNASTTDEYGNIQEQR